MPSCHRLGTTLSNEVGIDIKGIAVALAFLVSVSVFAGGRDNPTASEDRESPVVSMHIVPALTIEETGTVRHPDDDTALSGPSHTGQYSPQSTLPRIPALPVTELRGY